MKFLLLDVDGVGNAATEFAVSRSFPGLVKVPTADGGHELEHDTLEWPAS